MTPKKLIPRLVARIDQTQLVIYLSLDRWPSNTSNPEQFGMQLRGFPQIPDGSWQIDLLSVPLSESDPDTILQARQAMHRAQQTILNEIHITFTAADQLTQRVIASANRGCMPPQDVLDAIQARQLEEEVSSWGPPVDVTDWL